MEKKIQLGQKKGFLFQIGKIFGIFFFVILIKKHEKSQNLGSIPLAVQNYAEKNRLLVPPGLIGLNLHYIKFSKIKIFIYLDRFFLVEYLF